VRVSPVTCSYSLSMDLTISVSRYPSPVPMKEVPDEDMPDGDELNHGSQRASTVQASVSKA
jgi:hypothetical protein